MRLRVIVIVLALIKSGDSFTSVEKVRKYTFISSALDIPCLHFVCLTKCFNESKNKIWCILKVTPTFTEVKIIHLLSLHVSHGARERSTMNYQS